MKPQFRRIPQPKPKWTNHHNKGILVAVAIIFVSVAAVEKQVEWKTQNDKRLQFLINKLHFYPSILTCQNFDQSWWSLWFVGGNRELLHAKEEKRESNFCIYIINNTINCIFVNLLLVMYTKFPAKIMWLPIHTGYKDLAIGWFCQSLPHGKFWTGKCSIHFHKWND